MSWEFTFIAWRVAEPGFLHQYWEQLLNSGSFDGFRIQMPACQKRSIGGRRENLLMSDQIHVMSRWSREAMLGMHILKCLLALTPFEVDVSWHFKKTHYLCCCHVWNFSTGIGSHLRASKLDFDMNAEWQVRPSSCFAPVNKSVHHMRTNS